MKQLLIKKWNAEKAEALKKDPTYKEPDRLKRFKEAEAVYLRENPIDPEVAEKAKAKIRQEYNDGTRKKPAFYADLMETVRDAEIIYKFSCENICTNMQDITIMCEKLDFGRIVSKPEYQGDLIPDMFKWGLNNHYREEHSKLIKEAWMDTELVKKIKESHLNPP